MKKILFFKLIAISMFLTQTANAQFPAPLHFNMGLSYILIGYYGFCNGHTVFGPAYCTAFQWEAPYTSEMEATLIGYNIYYYETEYYYYGMEIPFEEGTLIARTTKDNTHIEMEIGIMGVAWVTAVYSDPEGESIPSNTQYENLPVAINKLETQPISLTYDKQKDGIEISGIENIASVCIFCLDGTAIVSVSTPDYRFFDTKGIQKGIYIVKITTKDGKFITRKLIIK